MKAALLSNIDLDRQAWDAFVYQSESGSIFNLSCYLDAVYPGWIPVIFTENESICAVLPLFPKKKFGFTVSLQSMFTRYSGIIDEKIITDKQLLNKCLKTALKGIRYCRFASECNFNTYDRSTRITYKLDISAPYDIIVKGYKSALRNKLNGFNFEEFIIEKDTDTKALADLFRHYQDIGKFSLPADYISCLENLYPVLSDRGMAKIITARTAGGNVAAAVLFMYFREKVYMFIALAGQESRKSAIIPYLIDREIQEQSRSYKYIDFLGSMISSVANFNKNFGAQSVGYYEVVEKRFPFTFIA